MPPKGCPDKGVEASRQDSHSTEEEQREQGRDRKGPVSPVDDEQDNGNLAEFQAKYRVREADVKEKPTVKDFISPHPPVERTELSKEDTESDMYTDSTQATT